jgi:hypothetical protein
VAAGAVRGGGVAGGNHATAAPARAWAGTRGYGPTWATGKRASSLILFPKFENQHKFVIQFGDFLFAQNSPKFE